MPLFLQRSLQWESIGLGIAWLSASVVNESSFQWNWVLDI